MRAFRLKLAGQGRETSVEGLTLKDLLNIVSAIVAWMRLDEESHRLTRDSVGQANYHDIEIEAMGQSEVPQKQRVEY